MEWPAHLPLVGGGGVSHSVNTTDSYLLHLHEQFQQGKLPPPYSVDKGILYFNGRFVLSTTSPLLLSCYKNFMTLQVVGMRESNAHRFVWQQIFFGPECDSR